MAQEAHRVKERAKALPHGKEPELLSLKARQLETASHSEWISRAPATEVGEHLAPGNSKAFGPRMSLGQEGMRFNESIIIE